MSSVRRTMLTFALLLLPWSECEPKLAEYCSSLGIPDTSEEFVSQLKNQLTKVAREVDIICQQGDQITINEEGIPVLKRITAQDKSDGAEALFNAIRERLPQRSVLDVLCNIGLTGRDTLVLYRAANPNYQILKKGTS